MKPKIQTLKYKNSFVSFCPERGGLITQININGVNILFLNEETFYNTKGNVRGGIPLMFPNAGPLFDDKTYKLKQHGFARNSVFTSEIFEDKIEMKLISSNKTKELFDYDFEFKIILEFINNGVRISQSVKNTGNKNIPISSGFHPYFYIEDKDKKNIKFKNFENNFFDIWSIGDTKYLKNISGLEVDFGKYLLDFKYDEIFEEIWLRSEPGKNFICIEPSLKAENGLVDNPVLLLPGKTEKYSFDIILKK